MKTSSRRAAALLAAVVALTVATAGLAACRRASTDGEPSRGTTSTPATTAPGTEPTATASTTLKVYFLHGEGLIVASRTVPATTAVASTAMRELLAGPTAAERARGLASAIPTGTELRGVRIADGVATVDLGKRYESGGGTLSMSMRLAQVVYTLTQFPTVTSVRFALDGKPVTVFSGEGIILEHPQTRADLEERLPAVLVESPLPGQRVTSPIVVRGLANTFEGVFRVQVRDPRGTLVADRVFTAGAMGFWKAFSVSVPFSGAASGAGELSVSTDSPKDGSRTVIVTVPVTLAE